MPRIILEESRLHPAIRDVVSSNHRDIVEEVSAAVDAHDIVVVGMAQNPMPKKARKLLDDAGMAYHYLEYGSYLKAWRRRNALKMWRSAHWGRAGAGQAAFGRRTGLAFYGLGCCLAQMRTESGCI